MKNFCAAVRNYAHLANSATDLTESDTNALCLPSRLKIKVNIAINS